MQAHTAQHGADASDPPPAAGINNSGAAEESNQGRSAAAVTLPRSDAEYAALPATQGRLQEGDVVAYRLLEIGSEWAPQVEAHAAVEYQSWAVLEDKVPYFII